ncbi:ABC transporter substrate-binding protein [Dissulfurispira thermophila]|uniref:ABC transporter substrate-binding protein n=1 Tax=Dissulfurispira thermophila TaxID=2715679 RepID=A0A7G1GZL8_9BACT|nr:ABC transporter substrate-binding protein [Dissulfurispira thermophila]BCB95945.1 ABC transporter substrate-binding protein [Dissulfurispira thermophila]
MTRKILLFIALFILVLAVSIQAASITYKDKLGRVVNISVPVKRAVFFETYEILALLDVWDKIVGIGSYAYDNDLINAVKPNIRNIPTAGSGGGQINIEVLLKQKPDVVIAWTWKPENIKFMEEKGLKVIGVYPESLDELYDVMRLHGKLFNRQKKVDFAIKEMQKIFSLIKERSSQIPQDSKKKVLWIGGKPTSVACGIGITNDIFRIIGGINQAGHIPQRNADVSIEQIIAWNPDVIFIWGNAKYQAKDILYNPQWRHIRAVRDGNVYKSPQWSTWSPRLAIVALWMAIKTYPEHFNDIDFERIAEDFYKKVYSISYSQVKQIEN